MPQVTPVLHPSFGDDAVLTQWTLFLQDYAKGHYGSPPPLLKSSGDTKSASSDLPPFKVPLYPLGKISRKTAKIIAEFYGQYGFLPPPRAAEEAIRLQTIREYNLFKQDQTENFHRCSSLVHSFFPFAPMCQISLFHNDLQVIVSKAGEFPVNHSEGIVTETSICGHVVLKKNGHTTELHNLAEDWRFAGNPCCTVDSNGIQGYVGVPITLEADPSVAQDSRRVTIGVIALLSNRPFPKLTETQRRVLNDLSTMLSVQLRSTWEGWQRGKQARLRNAVSLFLEKALVEPSQASIKTAVALTLPPVQGHDSPRRKLEALALTSDLFASAADQLQQLLEADFAIIIDLSAFHATRTNGRRHRSHSWVSDGQELSASVLLSKWILGYSSSTAYRDSCQKFNTPEAMASVASFLDKYAVTGRSVFSASGGISGLEGLLVPDGTVSTPSTPPERGSKSLGVPGTVPHLALPFYSSNRPNLLIVVASAAPFSLSNLIVAADAAKTGASRLTVFLFTHELRTPLHGLLGQLDLIRDSFSSGELTTVPELLDSAEFCGLALRDIVNDVLDFGKMANGVENPGRHALVDLAQLTLETAKSCWLRRLQWQTVSASVLGPQSVPPSVELVVEYEDRSMLKNWWITLDVSGFLRILNNLVTNSLKYTAEGLITISLMSGHRKDKQGNDTGEITLRVEDTGFGIAPEFLSKLFEPFTQADSFSPGAGLGLHICKSLVERMKGTIIVEARPGGGTMFTAVLPVEDIELAPPDQPRIIRRKTISTHSTEPAQPSTLISDASAEDTSFRAPTPVQTITPPLDSDASGDGDMGDVERHLKILVVDDNVISRKILVAMLKRLNATAYQAVDGINALEVFREVQPDVVWTDTAAKEMRKIEQENGWTSSHIVAITGLGLSDEHIRREALLGSAALDGWLIKGQTNLKSLKESLVVVRRKLKDRSSSGYSSSGSAFSS
ncbi:hypothetical protein C8R43DRAFT_995770 [Mycena crocata]|nr:hypothetical protein C8R43DRAFT_995770 [Mycena crocata]